MAHLRPRYSTRDGKKTLMTYHAEFYDPARRPHRKYVPLRTRNKQAARGRLAELEGRYGRREWDPWADAAPRDGATFDEAVELYVRARPDWQPRSERAFRSLAGLLSRRLAPGFPVAAVEPRHVALVVRPELSAGTRSTYHGRLAAFFTWCEREGLVDRSPLAGVKKPRVGRTTAPFLSRDEYHRLLGAIEGAAAALESGEVRQGSLQEGHVRWLADVVRVAVGTGFRLGELCALRWSAVDLDARFVSVKNSGGFRSKSGHERSVPVAGDAYETLARLAAGRGAGDGYVFRPTAARPGTAEKLNGTYVSKRLKHYAGVAGLPDGTHFHTLRHTYASWLVMGGAPLSVVKELLGHATIQMTEVYAHLAPSRLVADVARVFGDGGAGA